MHDGSLCAGGRCMGWWEVHGLVGGACADVRCIGDGRDLDAWIGLGKGAEACPSEERGAREGLRGG